jgi:hypothetical protein
MVTKKPIAVPVRTFHIRRRTAVELIIVAVMLLSLTWLKSISDRLQTRTQSVVEVPTLPFSTVWDQSANISLLATMSEVEQKLGKPSRVMGWGGEFWEIEEKVLHSNRHLGLPQKRIWFQWIDPSEKTNWVLILFADEKVYHRSRNSK